MAKVDSSVHVWAPHLVLTVLSLLRDRQEFGCLKVTSNYSTSSGVSKLPLITHPESVVMERE